MLPADLLAITPGAIKDGILVTALLLSALTVIIGTLVKLWRINTAIVMRQHESAELLERLIAEVLPNHGSSLRDAVDRVEAGQDDLRQQVAALRAEHTRTVGRVDDAYSLLARRADSNLRRRHDDPPPEED